MVSGHGLVGFIVEEMDWRDRLWRCLWTNISIFHSIVMVIMMGDDVGCIYVLLPTPDCAGGFSSGSWSKENDMIVLLLILISIDLETSFLLLMLYG